MPKVVVKRVSGGAGMGGLGEVGAPLGRGRTKSFGEGDIVFFWKG